MISTEKFIIIFFYKSEKIIYSILSSQSEK